MTEIVVPAKAGTHAHHPRRLLLLNSGFRRNDEGIVVPVKAGTHAVHPRQLLLLDSGFCRNDGDRRPGEGPGPTRTTQGDCCC